MNEIIVGDFRLVSKDGEFKLFAKESWGEEPVGFITFTGGREFIFPAKLSDEEVNFLKEKLA